MNIHFVLIEPQVPENIGAAARAIKTMGFSSLWLVNTEKHLDPKAKYVAHASEDILNRARHFRSFREMLAQLDLSIATTAKHRNIKQEYYPAEDLKNILASKSNVIEQVGIIFGREEYGLTNQEIKQCHMVSYVDMKATYPSLNLGQAVMIYSYLLSALAGHPEKDPASSDPAELKVLIDKVKSILPILDLPQSTNIYGRIMERLVHVQDDDIHLLHTICNEILKISNKE
jgi:tRNA/rRNA methyltransferase